MVHTLSLSSRQFPFNRPVQMLRMETLHPPIPNPAENDEEVVFLVVGFGARTSVFAKPKSLLKLQARAAAEFDIAPGQEILFLGQIGGVFARISDERGFQRLVTKQFTFLRCVTKQDYLRQAKFVENMYEDAGWQPAFMDGEMYGYGGRDDEDEDDSDDDTYIPGEYDEEDDEEEDGEEDSSDDAAMDDLEEDHIATNTMMNNPEEGGLANAADREKARGYEVALRPPHQSDARPSSSEDSAAIPSDKHKSSVVESSVSSDFEEENTKKRTKRISLSDGETSGPPLKKIKEDHHHDGEKEEKEENQVWGWYVFVSLQPRVKSERNMSSQLLGPREWNLRDDFRDC